VITRYGIDVFLTSILILGLLAVCSLLYLPSGVIQTVVLVTLGVLAALVVNFFRDPDRTAPEGKGIVVSPADGKVVVIRDVKEQEYLGGDAVQVSVFMSPLNVHVNRFPITGTVGHFRHIQGEYLVAFDDKSSERNERTHIGVESDGYRVFFKQIAGAVARRIVAPIQVGQRTVMGERFGMIKFGSRVDVIMPRSSVVKVQLGQTVRAGETILATYDIPSAAGKRSEGVVTA
jgi:phosphatidylserine decarboxylase